LKNIADSVLATCARIIDQSGGDPASIVASEEDSEARVAEMQAALARQHREASLIVSGFDRKHAEMAVAGTFDETTPVVAAREFMTGAPTILVLWGEHSRGKTFGATTAGAIAYDHERASRRREMRPGRESSLVVRAATLLETWRARKADLYAIPLLVIEDVGRESGLVDELAMTAAMVDVFGVRLQRSLKSIVTTNLLVEESKVPKADPSWRRLLHNPKSKRRHLFPESDSMWLRERLIEYGSVVHCDGPNLRRKT